MTHLTTRSASPRQIWQLEQQGLHPLLARLYAARGIQDAAELDYALERLLPPASLTHAPEAAALLSDAIEAGAQCRRPIASSIPISPVALLLPSIWPGLVSCFT